LKNVSFSFNELKILNSINLNISLGKSIAIVGKSGEGKSTLINIMAGLFKADDGDVCICNLRKLSYVSQKTQIMNTSLKENIVFGSEYCSENFSRVLDLTLLKDVVKRLPKNENSMIGEKGDLLSGGQLQRVGIARALYKNPNLLIMDEGTNSLDFYTENSILKNILNLNIAIIFVTHNIKIAHYFDETYSLDGGSLVEYALFKE
jgi:ABC-type bacteriocin/lantibiotic exporter with double-glycine peptidase domain